MMMRCGEDAATTAGFMWGIRLHGTQLASYLPMHAFADLNVSLRK